jgi:hypothetical protein
LIDAITVIVEHEALFPFIRWSKNMESEKAVINFGQRAEALDAAACMVCVTPLVNACVFSPQFLPELDTVPQTTY